jgi:hypothetical protein
MVYLEKHGSRWRLDLVAFPIATTNWNHLKSFQLACTFIWTPLGPTGNCSPGLLWLCASPISLERILCLTILCVTNDLEILNWIPRDQLTSGGCFTVLGRTEKDHRIPNRWEAICWHNIAGSLVNNHCRTCFCGETLPFTFQVEI